MSSSPEPMPVTLDSAREQFYLAQRASERFAAQLARFVANLEQQKEDDAWLEQVKEEAAKTRVFHEEQHRQWAVISHSIDTYVDSVRALAETMAVHELKGEATAEAELPENRAKTVHPELVKFQLEKKARILGKIGGVPALGPGMGAVLPALPKGTILKATASPAAIEIHYSKAEGKDAGQLANVFHFRKAKEGEPKKAEWQQEESAVNVLRASEAAAAELRRQQQEQEQLAAGGAVGQELAGALRQRQQRLKSSEEDEAAAAASSFRRVAASNTGAAHTPAPEEELQAATPELAQQLRKRQEAAEIARRHSEGEEARKQQQQQHAAGRSGSSSADGAAGGSDAPAWGDASAPFGTELASVLQKMRHKKDAADAARPVKAPSAAAPSISATASSELQERLRQRQNRLASSEEEQSKDQD
ncbi:hypothetical protein OEZ85_000652 [Tetradesmus obliquus]|uniref:Uncharacterized protein n=1 Tax=Tetradesmus obliquus TaxID=3088 RepID=A0ABY8UL78_TETOB|nr:hypothetical protein OEZ85_000652 [Tetradesmus obliquus]